MSRRTVLVLLALLLVVGGSAAWHWQAGVRKALEKVASGDAPPASLEEAVGVAMKGIELVQGEKGIELWRLKATWAQLRQENNIIDVDSPDVVYQMDGGKVLRVRSQKGEVQQQNQFVRMWQDVQATHEGHELFATLMLYNGTSRTMYFPEGARIAGESITGNATRLEWDVAANVLRGSEGVSMLLAPRNAQAAPVAGQPAQVAPAKGADAAKPAAAAGKAQQAGTKKTPGHNATVRKSSGQATGKASVNATGAKATGRTKQESTQ